MRRAVVGIAAVMIAAGLVATASAQRIDPRKPTTLVVGAPHGASPMQRVDARRSGMAKADLPNSPLKVAWSKPTGLTLDQPALSGADGTLVVVSVRGDVTYLDEKGDEKATIKVGASNVGPAAMTSDGTVVFMSTVGDVIGVKRGAAADKAVRYTTRIGGERNNRAAPLALDDGGVVIATLTDLVVLDAEGNLRARATLPEQPAAPLLAAGDKVIAIGQSGAVFGWVPGREPARIGSFGAPIDGGAALTAQGTLIAVIEGNQVAEVDVVRGSRTSWSTAPAGLYLGPPAVREVPGGSSIALLEGLTHTRGFVLALDPSGQELLRAPVASFIPSTLTDGGVPPLIAPPHVGPIGDARGAIAFASTDGRIGLVAPDGTLDMLGTSFCSKGVRSGVLGLTPFGAGAFAVTCEGGVVIRVVGAGAPAPPAPSGSSDKLRSPD